MKTIATIACLFSLLFCDAQTFHRTFSSNQEGGDVTMIGPFIAFINKNIANGNAATMEAGWVSVGRDSASTLLDIIGDKNLVKIGDDDPIFDLNNGWQFVGAEGVFNTQFNPPKNKVVSDSNSLTYSVWVLEPGRDNNAGLFGSEVLSTTVKTFVFEHYDLNKLSWAVGSFGSIPLNSYRLKHNTVYSWRRTDDSVFFFEDGTKLASVLDTPYEESKKNPYLGGLNQDGSAHPDTIAQQSHSRIGGAWISSENSDLDSLSANTKELYAAVFPWAGIDSIEVGTLRNDTIVVHTKQTLWGTTWGTGDITFSVGGQSTATNISFVEGTKMVKIKTSGAVSSGADGTFSYTQGANLITNSADEPFTNLSSVTISNNVGADVTPPTVASATINSATNLNIVFSENVVNVSASRTSFNFDGNVSNVIATSVSGSGSSYNFTFAADYIFGEVIDMDYSGGTVDDLFGNSLATIVDLSVTNNLSDTLQLAFPGCIGAGCGAVGGRGGTLYVVDNLNDSGPGSYREAVQANDEKRTVIFNIGGVIYLNSIISIHQQDDSLTIHGQTAPGDGIVIANFQHTLRSSEMIMRGMALRIGDRGYLDSLYNVLLPALTGTSEQDAISVNGFNQDINNVVWDHNTFMWSYDETVSGTAGHTLLGANQNSWTNVSITNNLIGEALDSDIHPESNHSKGSLFTRSYDPANPVGPTSAEIFNFTFARNIYTQIRDRLPALSSHRSNMETRYEVEILNNLINAQSTGDFYQTVGVNSIIEGNRFKQGLETSTRSDVPVGVYGLKNAGISMRNVMNPFSVPGDLGSMWINDNVGFQRAVGATPGVDEFDEVKVNRPGFQGFFTDTTGIQYCINCPPKSEPVKFTRSTPLDDIMSSSDVEDHVLAYAGSREDDFHNIRLKQDVIDSAGVGIKSQARVGGYKVSDPGTPWVDTDDDGIPDYFEIDYLGTDHESATSPNGTWDLTGNHRGYPNLERWTNSFYDIVTVSNFYINPNFATGFGDGSLGEPFTKAQGLTQIQLGLGESFAFARGFIYPAITAAAVLGSDATFRSYGAGGLWPVFGSAGMWTDPLDVWTFAFVQTNPNPIMTESFETHIPLDDPSSTPFRISGDQDPQVVSTDFAKSGTKSMKSLVPNEAPDTEHRSEIQMKSSVADDGVTVISPNQTLFTTRTFGWSMYLPAQSDDPNESILMQWKNITDPGDAGDPPLTIRMSGDNIKYNFKHSESDPHSGADSVNFGNLNDNFSTGVWHEFVVEIKYDYRQVSNGGSGHVKIWYKENGDIDPVTDLIVDFFGAIGYPDVNGPFFKLGVYKKAAWATQGERDESTAAGVTETTAYYDDSFVIEGPWIPGASCCGGPPSPTLIVDEDFTAWTSDDPDGFTVSGESGGNLITENPTGEMQIIRLAGGNPNANLVNVLSFNTTYLYEVDVTDMGNSSLRINTGSTLIHSSNSTGLLNGEFTTDGDDDDIQFKMNNTGDATITSFKVWVKP